MIATLTGTITNKLEKSLIIDVSGVGYLVHTPRRLLETINTGDAVSFYIHTNVREDDISLYGFQSNDEWKLFRMLITVSGVGPKSALEVMNAPLERLTTAISTKDLAFLTKIPGIGKKTAERLVIDLQGKVEISSEVSLQTTIGESDFDEDIIIALISLGFTRQRVLQGLKGVPKELKQEEEIIKYFLQHS